MTASHPNRASVAGAHACAAHASPWPTFAAGLSYAEIAADFPEVGEDEVRACRAYAADSERRVVVAG